MVQDEQPINEDEFLQDIRFRFYPRSEISQQVLQPVMEINLNIETQIRNNEVQRNIHQERARKLKVLIASFAVIVAVLLRLLIVFRCTN